MGGYFPALAVNPPPNLGDQLARAVQLRSLVGQQQLQQQEIQLRQLQAEQAQRNMDSQTAIMHSYIQNQGDVSKIIANPPPEALPDHIIALQQHQLNTQVTLQNLEKDKLEQYQKQQGLVGQESSAILNLPPEERRAAMADSLARLVKGQVISGDEANNQLGQMGNMNDQQLENYLNLHKAQSISAENQAKNEIENRKVSMEQAKLGVELKKFESTMPGGFAQPVEQKELSAYLAKPENRGKDAADFAAWKARQSPMGIIATANLLGPGGAPSSPLDQAAEKYWQSGEIAPGLGRSPGTTTAIMKRAAELHPEGELAANSAEFKANKAALTKVQTQADTVNAFENTAIKNLDQVLQTASKVPELGFRFANTPIRAINEKILGTPEMAAFRAALLTAQKESARVLNSATASGTITNQDSKELNDMLNGNLSINAMRSAVNQLKIDMGNRKNSYNQQLADIKGRLGGNVVQPSTTPPGNRPPLSSFEK